MTDKQIIEDFLCLLNNKEGLISTLTGHVITYKELRTAIMNCLKQAMEDGYAKCLNEALAQTEMDFNKTLISGKEDW